ncbi:MAG: ABC transporter permease [Candidatus Nanopelagicales bacterium]
MSALTYAKYETVRTLRNVRFTAFSLVFPLVLLVIVGGANRDEHNFLGTGISFALYYLVGMISWGAMMSVLSGGARIAPERQLGWVRQLRLTPLSPGNYLGTKVATGYLLALLTIVVLGGVAVIGLGVRMPLDGWTRMLVLVLIGLIPFAAMGIWFGHALSSESVGPVMGGTSALFALLGGSWGPITGNTGFVHDISQLIPSYWLVQAGQSAFTGQWWPAKGWLVIAAWSVVLVALAARAYQRDGERVAA